MKCYCIDLLQVKKIIQEQIEVVVNNGYQGHGYTCILLINELARRTHLVLPENLLEGNFLEAFIFTLFQCSDFNVNNYKHNIIIERSKSPGKDSAYEG